MHNRTEGLQSKKRLLLDEFCELLLGSFSAVDLSPCSIHSPEISLYHRVLQDSTGTGLAAYGGSFGI
jgi:hypothetical protein